MKILWMLRPERSTSGNNHFVSEVMRELQSIKRMIIKMNQEIQDSFAALQTEVQSVRDTEQAAVTLINGLQQQLSDALNSSTDPTEIVAAVQAVHDQLQTDAAPLAAAVTTQPPAGGADTGAGGGDVVDPTA